MDSSGGGRVEMGWVGVGVVGWGWVGVGGGGGVVGGVI